MFPRAFVLAAALLMAGSSLAWAAETAKPLKLAVIPKGTTHEFWQTVHAGARKAAEELAVEIIWKGPMKEDDREQQIGVVENFIAQKVDGIALAPLDDMALKRPVRESVRAGIPVVVFDSDLNGKEHTSFVATDNVKGGYMGGKLLIDTIGGQGKVVLLRYMEGSASTANREQGFLNAIKEHNEAMKKEGKPGIEIVSSNQYAGATSATAQDASERLISLYKSADGSALTIHGIFCPNESSSFGMLRALENMKMAGKVKFVGFDTSVPLVRALEEGKIHGLVAQNPFRMGYLAVQTMVKVVRKETVEPRVDTGVMLITPANLQTEEVQNLLHPKLK